MIDTDPGIDDALALLLAFRSAEWRVEALTVVAGNVPVDLGTRNVARVLAVAAPSRPPVVGVGPAGPLQRPLVTATRFHGEDGLGGVGSGAPGEGAPRVEEAPLARDAGDAADLLVRTARRWPGQLVIVALGPLTNLALAVERDVAAIRGARAVVAMGGSIAAGGNVTPAAEYNVYVDPEAAARVVAAALPLTLVPLDVTQQVLWTAARIERFAGSPDAVTRFAHALGQQALRRGGAVGEAGVTMHDPLAVAAALDASLVQTVELPLAVETVGELTRGATVADRRRPSQAAGWARCRVALAVEAERVLDLYEARVCRRSA